MASSILSRYKVLLVIFLTITSLRCTSVSEEKSDNFEKEKKQKQQIPESTDESQDEDKYPDGEYCADVTYSNPNTGTSSDYTLLVDIQDHKLIEIKFPQGQLDNHHFDSPEIDEEGHTSFESDRGREYEVSIKGPAENCFVNSRPLVQCQGITKSGRRCKHLTNNPNGLCWQHQNQK